MDRNLWTLLDIQNRGNDLNHVKYIRLWGSSHFQKNNLRRASSKAVEIDVESKSPRDAQVASQDL